MTETYLFDGKSASRLNDPALWTIHSGGGSEESKEVRKYHRAVPWLYRGTDLRAKAIGSLPFAIVNEAGDEIDTSDDYQNMLGYLPNPTELFELVEMSLTLLGRAYLYRLYNRVVTLDLRYVLATSITPDIDEQDGLIGFERQLTTGKLYWPVEDVIYFWARDAFTEIGPPADDACPGMAALAAAGVLYNLDEFVAAFFKRGAIKAMILQVGTASKKEKTKLRAWWRRVVSVANAWAMHILSGEVSPVVIGEGVKELQNTELTKAERENISVALGIPMTILWSTEASGLGGGGVVSSDERKFYEQTVVPEAKFIAATLNEQLFSLTGHRLVFRPETLDVFQVDEKERAQSFKLYTDTGIRLSIAAQMLGLELPTGVEYDDLDTMKEEDKEAAAERMPDFGGSQNPQPNPQQNAMRADLGRWERKALSKGADCSFESKHIPPFEFFEIQQALLEATTDEEVKAAFKLKAVRFIPEGADDPLPPVPNEIEFSDSDIDQALALWDEIMPQYRGMLDAELEGQAEFDGEQY